MTQPTRRTDYTHTTDVIDQIKNVTNDSPSDAVTIQLVRSIIAHAERLGLAWRLRPATVSTPQAGTMVIVDGTTIPIKAVSLVGALSPGDRVMLLLSTPSGCHVVGFTGSASTRVIDSLIISTVGTYYNATAEALVTSASVSGFLYAGNRYEISVGTPITSATTGHVGRFRLRIGSIAGTVITQKQHTIPVGGYTEAVYFHTLYDAPSSGLASIYLTCQRVAGATSNVVVSADPTLPIVMTLKYHSSGAISRVV